MNYYTRPLTLIEGVSVAVTFNYEQFCERDLEYIAQRLQETLTYESKWLDRQRNGELPARNPKSPCGCGGSGS